MKFLFVTLLMALAPQAASADPPHSRAESAFEGEPVPAPRQQESGPASEESAAPEQESSSDLLPAIQGIEAAIRDLIAEEDAIERPRQEDREIRDLNAQEEMALWAKGMFWATFATVGLTSLGVLLIWRTLIHTRDAARHAGAAVEEAQRATRAAEETVTVTRQIGVAQIRPYVTISTNVARWPEVGGPLTSNVIVTNTGQTPAMQCKVSGSFEIIPKSKPPGGRLHPIFIDGLIQGQLAPRQERSAVIETEILTEETLAGINKESSMRAFLHLSVSYSDWSGVTYSTRLKTHVVYSNGTGAREIGLAPADVEDTVLH